MTPEERADLTYGLCQHELGICRECGAKMIRAAEADILLEAANKIDGLCGLDPEAKGVPCVPPCERYDHHEIHNVACRRPDARILRDLARERREGRQDDTPKPDERRFIEP